jgi:hypothetical protein
MLGASLIVRFHVRWRRRNAPCLSPPCASWRLLLTKLAINCTVLAMSNDSEGVGGRSPVKDMAYGSIAGESVVLPLVGRSRALQYSFQAPQAKFSNTRLTSSKSDCSHSRWIARRGSRGLLTALHKPSRMKAYAGFIG